MSDSLTRSERLGLLAERRRRLLIRMLRDSNTVVPVPKLAEYIRDCEHDNPQSKDVLSIRLSLHHNHLPKLDEAAVVKYDQREEAVRPGQNFETLMDLLEKVGEEDLPHPDD